MTKSTENQKLAGRYAGTQAEAQTRRAPAAPASVSNASKGAPPSNTAPANYIDESTRIFRTGIDSLYLSWSGTLSQEFDDLLSDLKMKAQSPNPAEQSQAVLQLLDHRFEVSDKGKGHFPFVLRDNWFHVQISRATSKSMPLATAQISSELLTKSGYSQSVRKLEGLISQLGSVEQQKISRIDICADFYTDFNLELIPKPAWVMQAKDYGSRYVGDRFSGFLFGAGGNVLGRLYDKALEIETKSKKTFFYSLWEKTGWMGELPVWRMEFQFRREPLRNMGINSTKDLDKNLNGLWQHATQKWLRLTLPSSTDAARTRWPNHPLWNVLQESRFGSGNLQPLYRTRKERLPSDERLYVHGLSTVTSVMAEYGISDLSEALNVLAQKANAYHRNRRESGYSLGTYLKAKAAQKARKHNTRLDADPKDKDSEAYRKAKEGE
ncbi:MAG: replication initiation factor [Xanthomonadales bacterium]|nr:replication initiation factor [Xanthomonadales bacterium]